MFYVILAPLRKLDLGHCYKQIQVDVFRGYVVLWPINSFEIMFAFVMHE